jgi:hypothetical protein
VRENIHTHTKRPQFYTGVEAENSLRSKEKPGRYLFSPLLCQDKEEEEMEEKTREIAPSSSPFGDIPKSRGQLVDRPAAAAAAARDQKIKNKQQGVGNTTAGCCSVTTAAAPSASVILSQGWWWWCGGGGGKHDKAAAPSNSGDASVAVTQLLASKLAFPDERRCCLPCARMYNNCVCIKYMCSVCGWECLVSYLFLLFLVCVCE